VVTSYIIYKSDEILRKEGYTKENLDLELLDYIQIILTYLEGFLYVNYKKIDVFHSFIIKFETKLEFLITKLCIIHS